MIAATRGEEIPWVPGSSCRRRAARSTASSRPGEELGGGGEQSYRARHIAARERSLVTSPPAALYAFFATRCRGPASRTSRAVMWSHLVLSTDESRLLSDRRAGAGGQAGGRRRRPERERSARSARDRKRSLVRSARPAAGPERGGRGPEEHQDMPRADHVISAGYSRPPAQARGIRTPAGASSLRTDDPSSKGVQHRVRTVSVICR